MEKEKREQARRRVWEEFKEGKDRIKELEKIVSEYPDFMSPYSDIASCYFRLDDIDNTIRAYQRIIDLKDTFDLVWDDELGKAYLFTGNYDKAIAIFEKSRVMSYRQGVFHAFAYLKKGEKEKFEEQFTKWISEDLEKSFDHYDYLKYIKLLFDEEEAKLIEEMWNKYHEKYSEMDRYKLYCRLYKQHYLNFALDEEEFDDDDFEIPAKLNRSQFEELSDEYLYLDRKMMFGEPDDADKEKYFELQDLLFADTIY